MSYSQNAEESFILDYFKDKPNGKFVDIGAYDVFRFSNTRALYEKGWGGVLVEPQPKNYDAISDHYKGEPRIQVLNIAVGEPAGIIDFYESDGDAVGTTDYDHMMKWAAAGVKFEKITVAQMAVAEFMNEHCKDVDFLSIDTESTNMNIFWNIPEFVFERVKLLCIEHDGYFLQIQETLTPKGFTTLYLNAENIIMGK